MAPDPNKRHEVVHGPFQALSRTTQFWRRATGIYLSYKGAQVKAQALKLQGWDKDRLQEDHWKPHHTWAGKEMYSLCVDMRGFYLKVAAQTITHLLASRCLLVSQECMQCTGGAVPWGQRGLHAIASL